MSLFTQKKFLFIALLEDLVFIFFLFALLASGLEIILPGILANKIPLALIFTVFALLIFGYIKALQKENLPYHSFVLPTAAVVLVLALLFLIGIFMSRAFGIGAGFIQIALLMLALGLWLKSGKETIRLK